MGGVLTHTLIGILSGGGVYYFFRKPEFFLAVLIGNTIVDFFKFFIAAFMQKSINVFGVVQDSTYRFWADITNSFSNWFALGFILISFFAFLYHHHIIRKKTMLEYDELVWFFLFGVILHLVFDLFYIESSAWI
ncbi:MAG: hypothetical protein HRU03_03575 [Nanoarchaeales archaeon]|nr:hypothetical protein [Nanoarchaeales archaeon]